MRNLAALIESAEAKTAVARVIEEASPGSYPEFAAAARRAVELHAPLIEKPIRSKPWEDGEVSEKRKEIEMARQRLRSKPGDESRQHLANAAKALADMYVDKPALYYAEVATDVERASDEGKSKAAFSAINRLTGRKAKTPCGVEADSPADRVKVLQSHFQKLLSAAPPTIVKEVNQVLEELPIEVGPFTLGEMQAAVATMPCGKALGVDEVPVELLRNERVQQLLLPIFNTFGTTEEAAPYELLLASLIAIFKNKGSAADVNNYRGIALNSLSAKLRNKMLLLRIRPHLDPLLRQNQNGFRPRRGTTQQVLALRRVFEQCRVKQGTRCVATFIDYSKAFDSVSRSMMQKILMAYGVPEKVVAMIMYMYNGSKSHVMTSDGPSDEFEITAGVLQGDTLAPFLFVIIVDWIMRNAIEEIGEGVGFSLQQNSTRIGRRRDGSPVELTDLDFADDIALLSDNMADAQRLLAAVEHWALAVGLKINKGKTRVHVTR